MAVAITVFFDLFARQRRNKTLAYDMQVIATVRQSVLFVGRQNSAEKNFAFTSFGQYAAAVLSEAQNAVAIEETVLTLSLSDGKKGEGKLYRHSRLSCRN